MAVKYSKVIVAVCVGITCAFATAVLFIDLVNGNPVQDSLIIAVFGMYGLELKLVKDATADERAQEPGGNPGKHTKEDQTCKSSSAR